MQTIQHLVNELGIEADRLLRALLDALRTDDALGYHLEVCSSDPEMLSILLGPYYEKTAAQMATSVAAAYMKWIGSGARATTDAEFERRVSICRACPHARPPGPGFLYRLAKTQLACGICGCDITRKARLPQERCPDIAFGAQGRWTPEHDVPA